MILVHSSFSRLSRRHPCRSPFPSSRLFHTKLRNTSFLFLFSSLFPLLRSLFFLLAHYIAILFLLFVQFAHIYSLYSTGTIFFTVRLALHCCIFFVYFVDEWLLYDSSRNCLLLCGLSWLEVVMIVFGALMPHRCLHY